MRTISVSNRFFALAAEHLADGLTVRIKVQGESMYPFLHSGDEIEIVPVKDGEDIPLWTAVFYEWNGSFMVHRLVNKRGDEYDMLGDGNLVRIETLKRSEIKGVLNRCFRKNGKVVDCRSEKWLNRGKFWFKIRRIRKYVAKLLRMLGV
ncbi:MAG: S24 family peptidase [Prevotellaceae bacterium]|nr:S24 family peptidase [Candidatus Minthosoma equi]